MFGIGTWDSNWKKHGETRRKLELINLQQRWQRSSDVVLGIEAMPKTLKMLSKCTRKTRIFPAGWEKTERNSCLSQHAVCWDSTRTCPLRVETSHISSCSRPMLPFAHKTSGIAQLRALTGTIAKSASSSLCTANTVHPSNHFFSPMQWWYLCNHWQTPTSCSRGETSGVKKIGKKPPYNLFSRLTHLEKTRWPGGISGRLFRNCGTTLHVYTGRIAQPGPCLGRQHLSRLDEERWSDMFSSKILLHN